MIRIFFFISCLLVAMASLRFLVMPIGLVMQHMEHYLPRFAWPIYGHMIFGPIALALLPLQMTTRLRAAKPQLHRVLGRIAVVSMLISGASSLAMLPGFKGSDFAAAGFAAMGALWIAFTLLAVQAARARDIPRHRAFMLRAAALTFGAVTLRIIMAPLMATGWTVTETYDITAWGCWLPSLLIVEGWMLRQSKRAPVGAL